MRPLQTFQTEDITTDLAPPQVAKAAKQVVEAIEARYAAQKNWQAAKDKHLVALDEKPSDVEKLRARCDDLAHETDRVNKVAAGLSRELASAIAEHSAEWTAAIDVEVTERKQRIADACDLVHAELEEVTRLLSVRDVAVETSPRLLTKFKRRSYVKEGKEGVALIRKWLTPPEERTPAQRALNYGPLRDQPNAFTGMQVTL
jgi:hypothetical protein